MSLKKPYFNKTLNLGFMRLCLMRGRTPTPFMVGNVMTVSRQTLLNASVQDHRRSDFIYSMPCSKAGSALYCPSPDFYQSYSEKLWALKVCILAIKKKIQTKFWGCSLKVLCLALSIMDRKKNITLFFFATTFHVLKDYSLICQESYHLFCSKIGTTSLLRSAAQANKTLQRPGLRSADGLCTAFPRTCHTYQAIITTTATCSCSSGWIPV